MLFGLLSDLQGNDPFILSELAYGKHVGAGISLGKPESGKTARAHTGNANSTVRGKNAWPNMKGYPTIQLCKHARCVYTCEKLLVCQVGRLSDITGAGILEALVSSSRIMFHFSKQGRVHSFL